MSEAVHIVKNISLIQRCTTVTSAQWDMPDTHLGCERRFSSCRHTQVSTLVRACGCPLWFPKDEGGGGEARSEGLAQRAVSLSCPSLQEVCSAPPCGESSPSCTRSPGPGHLLVWLHLKISFIPGAHTVRIRMPVGKGIYLSRGLVMLILQVKGKAPLNKTLQG